MPRILKEALRGLLSEEELAQLYGGFDIIGDIAIIKIPESLLPKKNAIAQALLNNVRNVRCVLRQTSAVSGEYRTRGLEFLIGEDRRTTLYREHGCSFKVNVANAYFSPRLSTERLRIAKLVQAGEMVINMFGGVGSFSILIARKQPLSQNITMDLNPLAHELALENIAINKVKERVHAYLGDAREIISSRLKETASRVLMPLPEKSSEYLDIAAQALSRRKGMIHYYCHIFSNTGEDSLEKAKTSISNQLGASCQITSARIVREVGPRWSQVVVDVKL